MNDDCDHELAVVPDDIASTRFKSDDAGSNGSGSGVHADRTSGGREAAAMRTNASPDEVRQLVRATAELFVPDLAEHERAAPTAGDTRSGEDGGVEPRRRSGAPVAGRTHARAKRDTAAHAVPEGVRDLIRATAEIFASADAARAHAGDANADSAFQAALSNIDADAFASDAGFGSDDDDDASLEAAVLIHLDAAARSHLATDAVAASVAAMDADADSDADGDGDADADAVSYEADPEAPAVSQKVKSRVRTKRTRMRSKTIAMKRLTRAELQRGAVAHPPVEGVVRPTVRSECAEGMRPCPFVACKHHLYLDINPRTGSIKINFPDLEPWELQHTCALDVADNGGLTLEEIGLITNLTRERVRQVEVRGLLTLRTRSNALR